jgi:hypothetical protein
MWVCAVVLNIIFFENKKTIGRGELRIALKKGVYGVVEKHNQRCKRVRVIVGEEGFLEWSYKIEPYLIYLKFVRAFGRVVRVGEPVVSVDFIG